MRYDQADSRNIIHGKEIPSESYCDQPYLLKTDDGAWLCVVTTGSGREGEPGQHVMTMRSDDLGRTWSEPVALEPDDSPENSYAVLLKTDFGRVYCFYNHNTDNIRALKADDPPYTDGLCRRVDSAGYYVFRYSDDHGRTWSAQRYEVPVREMQIDRSNVYGGKIRFFWNVGKPFVHDGEAFLSIHKVGGFGVGFFTRSEGVLVSSDNLLTEPDPGRINWRTLPEGEHGLRTPPGGGPISEEQSYCVLSDGSLHCIYRTVDGHPVTAYSRDRGRHWTTPAYTTYGSGRRMKHPRAAVFAWRCDNGKYLCWFHNHGGKNYEDRNPVWVCGGEEYEAEDGKRIRWSEPEVLLYDDDPMVRMSYPDLIEEDGRYFITETQKSVGRLHEIRRPLLESLWGQFDNDRVVTEGCILHLPLHRSKPETTTFPALPRFTVREINQHECGAAYTRQGFSIELLARFKKHTGNQVLLDTRSGSGRGFAVVTNDAGAVEVVLCDGQSESRCSCNPDLIGCDRPNHIIINIDTGPRIISFVIDGRFDDGGRYRQFGWGRISPALTSVNGEEQPMDLSDPHLYLRVDADECRNMARITPGFDGQLQMLRVYNHCLLTSEAIGNYRAVAEQTRETAHAKYPPVAVGRAKPSVQPSR